MGSPLALIIANYFMETFDQHSLNMDLKKPSYWYGCILATWNGRTLKVSTITTSSQWK
jgi:hypothetical protein